VLRCEGAEKDFEECPENRSRMNLEWKVVTGFLKVGFCDCLRRNWIYVMLIIAPCVETTYIKN
jgi:hypothetical protein